MNNHILTTERVGLSQVRRHPDLEIVLSDHAEWRCAQRNLSYAEIVFLCENGNQIHNAGVIFCQFRRDRIPDWLTPNHPYQRLAGSTVILCKCGHFVITAYRDEEAFQKDKRKAKYCWRQASQSCPYCSMDQLKDQYNSRPLYYPTLVH